MLSMAYCSCLSMSISSITELYPNQDEATEWYDLCMLRYSNSFLFSSMEAEPTRNLSNDNVLDNSADADGFKQASEPAAICITFEFLVFKPQKLVDSITHCLLEQGHRRQYLPPDQWNSSYFHMDFITNKGKTEEA
ncbi:hypothetical protein FEM48_Zijuj01G0101200 [Ziziphus jujuba var. spinosa]|uniref:Uncharacterized protein n=1 Tax=Ziziphus jujuba var. spinosa TaxID=714518 RepID=A0A978W0M3_ZIZJJ|nr:hypothetical protein FEM48_Zijuj01G0101200 [Ziziphus jujuba var. spinosa]